MVGFFALLRMTVGLIGMTGGGWGAGRLAWDDGRRGWGFVVGVRAVVAEGAGARQCAPTGCGGGVVGVMWGRVGDGGVPLL